MLDEFSSDNADDYIAGFPNHPHRGFETVTYMLDGHMLHQDHMGNRGDLKSGDVQWMTAGPRHHPLRDAAAGERAHARLPALDQPAGEGKDEARRLPRHTGGADPGGGAAGRRPRARHRGHAGQSTAARPPAPCRASRTEPLYFDVELPAGGAFSHPVKAGHNAFVYVYEGGVEVGPAGSAQALKTHSAGVLAGGRLASRSRQARRARASSCSPDVR